MADRIRLVNMVFYAYHGVFAAERRLGQRFEVDVDLAADLRRAGQSDDLADTLNYAEVYNVVKNAVTERPYHLLEALAERIAGDILASFEVAEVTVRVRKPGAPVGGLLDYAEVEITRGKGPVE